MPTEFKIFKANRLKLAELAEDAFNYLRNVYKTEGREFTMASPFAQIINVVLNLGRMILFYIENSITELNINTAFHERSIRGIAALTGHTPSTGVAARGALYMTYKNTGDYDGQTIKINNFTKIKNVSNGLTYVAVFPGQHMRLTVGAHDSKIEIPIIQGEVKYQQATGTGESLQSFNFANKTNDVIDNFFVNVYVNGERWEPVVSLLDMGYEQKAYIIKTSFNGGIDVFFGTGNSGAIPEKGASILCEYLVSAGAAGNILENDDDNYWTFMDSGYDIEGNYVDLNDLYVLSSASEVLFGSQPEHIEITRQLAPNLSRSFVLANANNYKYFLTKMNMFSVIDAFSGFNTLEDNKLESLYNTAKNEYEYIKESYMAQVNMTGKSSAAAEDLYKQVIAAQEKMENAKAKFDDATLDDNVIYLYLLPDISKRINDGENYFTCGVDRFKLTDDEKNGILNLIEDSGQKIITAENKILDPIFVNFAVNIFVQIWSNYNFNAIKSSIINALSEYFIKNKRRDRIPVSDLIRIVESISGVDSVSIFFDADKNNSKYYGEGNYGIDEYGDIILTRNVADKFGNQIQLNDLHPLFRGGFTSSEGVEYGNTLDSLTGPINITLRGRS